MAFEPKSDNHAIVEVVFGLLFQRNFAANEVEALSSSHDRWKKELPRINRSSFVQFMIGEGEPPPEIQLPSAGGVMFDRIKPDGNLEWRLRADQRSIYVNCLEYGRWADVWARARRYMSEASEIVAPKNPVVGVLLQYIDVFEWSGKRDGYQLSDLLEAQSRLVATSVMDKGPLWHLHQGWYRRSDLPMSGRVLERVNIDGVEDGAGIPTVKIDTYMQLDLSVPVAIDRFFGDDAVGDRIFDGLHAENKALLTSVLTKDMAKRIGLNAAG